MSDAEDRVRMALWNVGCALRWLGGTGRIYHGYAIQELETAISNIRKAESLDVDARDRMAAAAVAPVEAA